MGKGQPDEFFSVPKLDPSKLSFFDLPATVRRSIYGKAGLLTGKVVNLSFPNELECLDSSDESSSDEDDEHHGKRVSRGSITYNLLQTCRTIYYEIIPIIYSSNIFIIESDLLNPLGNLSPDSMASLTRLIVRLNPLLNDHGHRCCRSPVCGDDDWDSLWKPLSLLFGADEGPLKIWQQAATRLASYIRPHRLMMKLVCDTSDDDTAAGIVAPLAQFPPLKSCSIRLGCRPDPVLCQIAEETVYFAGGGAKTNRFSSPFPFGSLPAEVQYQILNLTDLVAPCKIVWSPYGGFHLLNTQRGCPRFLGCFCSRYHAAFSQRCQCWRPPSALFLVSRDMRYAALEIFYSRNEFIVFPRNSFDSADPSCNKVEASLFLQDFVPQCAVYHLRSLDIMFSLFSGDYILSNSEGYQSWVSALSYLAQHANLPRLTLMLRTIDSYQLLEQKKLCETYTRVLTPLETLTGLKDLFIELASSSRPHDVSMIRAMERDFEQRVMGTGYDSETRGKVRLSERKWWQLPPWSNNDDPVDDPDFM
jgi:hypothetical protein